jgi:hypothetical protein
MNDPILRETSWVPQKFPDFMQGESRLDGTVIPINGWIWQSDRARVKRLRELAKRYGGDPHMRFFVVNTVLKPAGVEQRDYPAQAAALLRWVQENIYYTNEPDEQVQSPWRTIKERTGDCDDSSVLLASMAESIRLPWKFALAGKNRQGKLVRWIEGNPCPWGVQYAHIYVVLGWPPFAPSVWASAEQTVRGAPLGYDVTVDGIRRWNEVAGSMPELAAQAPDGSGHGNDGRQLPAPRSGSTWIATPQDMGPSGSMGPGTIQQHHIPTTTGYTTSMRLGGVTGSPYAGMTNLRRRGPLGIAFDLSDKWDDIVVGVVVGVMVSVATTLVVERLRRKKPGH